MSSIHLKSQPLLPKVPKPICIIGAGGIVRDAHLPAYRIAGFPVHSITSLDLSESEKLAGEFGIEHIYETVEELVANAPEDAVYDVAIPASHFADTLRLLPDHAAVLIQKPMGESLEEAEEILNICREKQLVAAVNLQLRFAPFIAMARDAIEQGLIGELTDLEIRVNVETPWHLWKFMEEARSAEIFYHSIHYIDLIRSFLGNPESVYCKSMGSHLSPKIDCTRSSYILDYGPEIRVNVHTNHGHRFGKRHQDSFVKWEGTKGAIKAQMGLLMDYPEGEPEWFEMCLLEEGKAPEWQSFPIEGSWFPHAFIGTMGGLMHKLDHPESDLPHSVEDVYHTMRVADAAERSSLEGGEKLN